MDAAVGCCAVALALLIAVSDVRSRTIPNAAVLALSVLGLLRSLATGLWIDPWTLAAAVVLGLAVFMLGCFGTGDVKFFWAAMLLVPGQIQTLLVATALSGLVLAVVYLAMHGFHPREVGALPYGAAISAGLGVALCSASL